MLSLPLVPSAAQAQTEVPLQDCFNHPDGPSLGSPWTEEYELPSQFIEIENLAATFHCAVPPGAISPRPCTLALLSYPVTRFPVKFSFTFAAPKFPGDRIFHRVGLTYSSGGITQIPGETAVMIPSINF